MTTTSSSLCPFFLRDTCRFGSECKNLHTKLPLSDAPLLPSPPPLSSIIPDHQKPCTFFLKGGCKYGDGCRYLHTTSSTTPSPTLSPSSPPPASETVRTVCSFFVSQSCKYGERCRNIHPTGFPVSTTTPSSPSSPTTIAATSTPTAPSPSSPSPLVASDGTTLCRYHLQGACKFGEQCRYLHTQTERDREIQRERELEREKEQQEQKEKELFSTSYLAKDLRPFEGQNYKSAGVLAFRVVDGKTGDGSNGESRVLVLLAAERRGEKINNMKRNGRGKFEKAENKIMLNFVGGMRDMSDQDSAHTAAREFFRHNRKDSKDFKEGQEPSLPEHPKEKLNPTSLRESLKTTDVGVYWCRAGKYALYLYQMEKERETEMLPESSRELHWVDLKLLKEAVRGGLRGPNPFPCCRTEDGKELPLFVFVQRLLREDNLIFDALFAHINGDTEIGKGEGELEEKRETEGKQSAESVISIF